MHDARSDGREGAEHLVDQALALKEQGDVDGAIATYRRAIDTCPDYSVPHYNLGLIYKYVGRWSESLACNQRAAELAPDDEAPWWNLGIAATALGDWREARRAWAACGMKVPPGDGPPDFNFGWTPVRLDPDGDAEVVWARRLDPARALVQSIPLPTNPHNFGTLVLNDGAAEGFRVARGVEYPVFDVLGILEPSPFRKYVMELATADDASIEALTDLASEMGGAAENWGTSTSILCAKCSRGVPHEHPEGDHPPAHPHCGLAARDDEHAESIIRAWLASRPRADLVRWYDAAAE